MGLRQMTELDQHADLDWAEGVPVARRFDDPYYSLQDGLAETRHVFLSGNDLPARFADGFHIAELGFGTGLNLLAAWQAWRAAGVMGRLTYTSFEAFPLAPAALEKALSAFGELAPLAKELVAGWTGGRSFLLGDQVAVTIVVGDARDTLPAWTGGADAWFLDGFSPAKNPQLWEPDLLRTVADKTNPDGTFATYTAAGHVRRALQAAGFDVQRKPGFGRKRHMTTGRLERRS